MSKSLLGEMIQVCSVGEEFLLDTHSSVESSNAKAILQVCHISNHDEDATLAISAKVYLHLTQVMDAKFRE